MCPCNRHVNSLLLSSACLASLTPSSSPSPSSLVLLVLQQFLQALDPEEVTSYFGPEATLKGTCPSLLSRGCSPEPAGHVLLESGLCWEEVQGAAIIPAN